MPVFACKLVRYAYSVNSSTYQIFTIAWNEHGESEKHPISQTEKNDYDMYYNMYAFYFKSNTCIIIFLRTFEAWVKLTFINLC